MSWKERLSPLKKLWAPVFLIALVLGTIYTGIATPTESAAMGAVGVFLYIEESKSAKLPEVRLRSCAKCDNPRCSLVGGKKHWITV